MSPEKNSPETGNTAPEASASGEAAMVYKPGKHGPGKPDKKKGRGLLIGIGVVIVVIIAIFGIYFYFAGQIDGEATQAGTLPQEVKTLPEYTGKGIITMLVCGIDYDNDEADGYTTDEKIGRTDMILYVVYDTVNNKVNLLQIPRDVYVGDELETGGTGKINGLYYWSQDPDNRMDPLARAVNDQLGLPVDYYITIDMDSVKEIIDIKGTIPVYVPMEVSDPRNPGAVIEPGWRDFTSDEAEFFLRNRTSPTYHEQGDIMRLQMQQSFYSALYREFKQLSPTDLLMWMRVLLWRCDTDMDPVQLGGLAQKALKLESKDITFVRPPVAGAEYNGNSLLTLLPEETADLLNEYFRPEGRSVPVEDLNIQTLPVSDAIGISEASIRTMADVQSDEPVTSDASQTA